MNNKRMARRSTLSVLRETKSKPRELPLPHCGGQRKKTDNEKCWHGCGKGRAFTRCRGRSRGAAARGVLKMVPQPPCDPAAPPRHTLEGNEHTCPHSDSGTVTAAQSQQPTGGDTPHVRYRRVDKRTPGPFIQQNITRKKERRPEQGRAWETGSGKDAGHRGHMLYDSVYTKCWKQVTPGDRKRVCVV